jgi:hypothetical protein
MPDPDPQPTPATPDELATLFLRARDIPCPKCSYNRRDGNTSACPECGAPLSLNQSHGSIPRIAILLFVVATFVIGIELAWSLGYAATAFRHDLRISSNPSLLTLRVVGAILLPTAAAIVGLRAWLNRHTPRRQIRYLLLAALIFVTHELIEHAWTIPGKIQYIQDQLNPAIIQD